MSEPNGIPKPDATCRVLELHPDEVYTPDDNRSATPESVSGLVRSIADIGQQVPGMVSYDAERKKWKCIGGNRRLLVCRILGLKFKAVAVTGEVGEADVVKLRLTENCIREAMSALEVADDIARYMELTECTQIEAGDRLNLSQATVSKVLSVKRLPEDLKARVANFDVKPSVAYLISSLPSADMQREMMQQVVQGGLKKTTVEKMVQRLKGKTVKLKAVRLKMSGIELTLRNPTVEAVQAFIDKMSAALKKLARESLPITLLPELLG